MKKQYIAVDFDGTLATMNYPKAGKRLWIHKLIMWYCKDQQKKGVKIILNTLRKTENLEWAVNWCHEHDFYPDLVNENPPERIAKYGDSRKIGADLFIDDRNIGLFGWFLRKLSNDKT